MGPGLTGVHAEAKLCAWVLNQDPCLGVVDRRLGVSVLHGLASETAISACHYMMAL